MQDNLSLYHIFYTVARTGSISHSSRDLYISQPAISKAIQKLEQNLDTVLFKRSSRGVTLTPDGELLFEKVKEALSLLDEGENSIRHNRSRDIPKLRLGASSTLTRYVLLSHLENYIARFPHVRITISCQSTYQTLQLLDEEKIDLGLIGRPQKLRGYYFQPLLKIQDTFVCTQQYLENQKKLYPDEPLIQAATFMMLDEDNITEGSKYWHLTELAAKCTAKRMVPDYISAKIMKELKKGEVYPCMGCRSFLTVEDSQMLPNGRHKFYGRFNQGVVTINLVDVACSSEGDMDRFWQILDERLELCHRALRCRHERLLGTISDVAPILWQNGALARLKKWHKICRKRYRRRLPPIDIAQAYGNGEGVGAAMAESGLPMGRDATPLWLTKVQQYAGGAVWLCLQHGPA